MRIGITLCTASVLIMFGAIPTSVAAEPPPSRTTCTSYGDCQVRANDPGRPGSTGAPGNGAAPQPAPSRPARQCTSAGQTIPCSLDGSYWSSRFGCHIDPQPVDPVRAGFPPETIAAHPGETLHRCIPFNYLDGGATGIPAQGFYRWLDAGTTVADYIDPEVLARTAIEQMDLRPIDIGLAPPPTGLALVGLPVHMWVADPREGTWQATETAAAGSVSVTARAQVERVSWNMGDGTQVTCGLGTAYSSASGAEPSPTCGHTYRRSSSAHAGGAYTVTATSYWRVSWTSTTDQSGTIYLDLATSTQLRVGESQVVVTRG